MTWKCKTGACVHTDLPEDFPLICLCASMTLGKITESDLVAPRELHRLRQELAHAKRDAACLKAVQQSIEALNAAEAA